MTFNVLVLDAAQRSALAVTRSLGKIPNVSVSTAEASGHALAGKSRYSSCYYQSPSAEHSPQAYIDWIAQLQSQQHFDLIIPVTEITSQLLLMSGAKLPDIKLPFSDYQTLMKLADKGNLVKTAERVGIPTPQSTWYANTQALSLETVAYPVVVKPCLSKIFAGDKWIATKVCVVHSREELLAVLHTEYYLAIYPFMLQEFIPGHGAGIFAIYDHGNPIAFFAHNRLREKPPEGGVSVLSESIAIDERLKIFARLLLDDVHWHGVAMIEFRMSPQGIAYLMEVNTRFWGSLQLAIDSGVDFPRLLIASAQHQTIDAIAPYKIGQRLRWLMGDLDSLYLFLKSQRSVRQKIQRIFQFFTPHFFSTRHEINRLDDLQPAIHEFKRYCCQLLGR